MKVKKILITFIVSVVQGTLLWIIFPFISKENEPFDSIWGYIIIGVLGFVLGLSDPQKPWLWALGLYLGQFLFGSFSFIKSIIYKNGGGVNLFIPLGAIFLLFFCMPALVGSYIGASIRKYFLRQAQ